MFVQEIGLPVIGIKSEHFHEIFVLTAYSYTSSAIIGTMYFSATGKRQDKSLSGFPLTQHHLIFLLNLYNG